MKYIMLKETSNVGVCYVPIIFPSALVHSDVADAMIKSLEVTAKGRTISVDSAGELSLFGTDFVCHGSSETLGICANSERDTQIIKMNDYGGGLVFR